MAAPSPSVSTVPLRLGQPVASARFDDWTYEEAIRHLEEAVYSQVRKDLFDIARAYGDEHDFWRRGDEWIGPGKATSNDKIKAQYAPDDVLGEAISNIGNAFSEPKVSFAPLDPAAKPEDYQPLIQEATAWISAWWDRVRAHEAVLNRLHASAWAGRAAFRPWVPGRFMQSGQDGVRVLPAATIPQALRYIALSTPDPAACAVYTDPASQDRCVIFAGEQEVEGQTRKWVELTYLDPRATDPERADTIFRIVAADGDETREYRVARPLGGHLVTAEMVTQSLVTEPVVRSQRQLNFLSSIPTRIGETAAFRERYISNAIPHGTREPYEEGAVVPEGAFVERDRAGKAWLVRPADRTLGSPTTTELVGLPTYTNGAVAGHETPTVQIFDPVDPTPYLRACEAVRARILRMCRQGHLANTSTAETSGFAYEQARSAFEKDLNRRKSAEEGMLRDAIGGVIALAEMIAGKPGYITGRLRVTVEQSINAGARNPDSIRVDMEARDKGLLSDETTMARLNVEDIKPEMDAIKASPAYILNLLGRASEASSVFSVDAILRVLEAAGVPDELIAALRPQDTDDMPLPPTPERPE